MASTTPDQALIDLGARLTRLETRFARNHFDVVDITEDISIDLEAYVVLSHAEFEGFFEHLSTWLLGEVVGNWARGDASAGLLSLTLRYGGSTVRDWDTDERHFDRIRKYLDNVAASRHAATIEGSHGTDIKYLRRLLGPLGVDLPEDAKLRGSLAQLVKARGAYAHKGRIGASTPKAPRDLVLIVGDCVELATLVRDRVVRAALRLTEPTPTPAPTE